MQQTKQPDAGYGGAAPASIAAGSSASPVPKHHVRSIRYPSQKPKPYNPYCLRDIFLCTESSGNTVLLSNGARVFRVTPYQHSLVELIGPMPTMVITTLLPYAGRIITNERVRRIAKRPHQNAAAIIDEYMSSALEEPIIETGRELLDHIQTLPPNYNVIPEFTQIIVSNQARGMLSSFGTESL